MEYQRGRIGRPSTPGPATVTGRMLLDSTLECANMRVNSAFFEPGAHTHWHSHSEGQLFIIGHGEGIIATRDGEVQIVRAGDIVFAPAGEEHWHGATADTFVAYTAASIGSTDWLEAVADADYEAAAAHATSDQ